MKALVAALFVICAVAATSDAAGTTEGRLVTKADGKVVDVPLEHTDVVIKVDGHVAETRVTQRFTNPYAHKIEAVYLFPLPTGAAIGDMAITTGGRTITGSILERSKAKQIYEAAKQQGLVAALLAQERPNLFTQAVANLEPKATIDVTIRYVERLSYEDGGYALVFPMVAVPRYVPAASKVQADAINAPTLPAGLRSSHDISLRVEVDAGVAIEEVVSSSHQISVERPTPARAIVQIRSNDTIPNKDFSLTYRVAGEAPKFAVIGSTGSFLFVAQPPVAAKPTQIAPREIVFVLDTSSSMRGAPLAKAKELIRRVLWTMRPDDTFQIVRFADRSSALGPGPIAAKPKNVELTLQWLAQLEAAGGTEMVTGIAAALAVPHDPLRLRILAFITDGYVGNEDEILATVGKRVGASRLFAFGVGTAINRYLLEEMASIGRGAVQFVRPDEDTAKAVSAFERRIDMPVLTDIRIDWGKLAVRDTVPAAIPDLFVGQPLVLSGHYAAPGTGTVTVHAKQAGRDVHFEVPVALPATTDRPAIGAVWARARIAELSRALIRKADESAQREIIELSIAHRVLTQYTAFVAVDSSRVTAGGDAKRVVVPVEIPAAARNVASGAFGQLAGGVLGDVGGYGYGYSAGVLAGESLAIEAPAPPPPPKVIVQMPPTIAAFGVKVIGGDVATVKRYAVRLMPDIRYCYERALRTTPELTGTVTARFTIGVTGKVTSSTASGIGNKEVEACIAQVMHRLELPKQDDGPMSVDYPLKLEPGRKQTR
ncbi:MAG: VIT domain-containing protein [Kofleriaceae bacterium]